MFPAAAYHLLESAMASAVLVLLLASTALPIYLLVFRPIRRADTWGISEMAAITVLFVVTLPLAATLAGITLPLSLLDLSTVTLAQNALLVGLSAYVVMGRYALPPARLGLAFGGWPRGVLLGFAAAAVVIPLALVGEDLAIFLLGIVEGPAQAAARAEAEHLLDPLRPVLEALPGGLSTAWFLILLAVIVPVGEEVFFRGFIYGGLRDRWGAIPATLASAVFFSIAHLQLVHGLPILVLGVLLAFLYERTRSLVPVIVTHALNNVIAIASIWYGWG